MVAKAEERCVELRRTTAGVVQKRRIVGLELMKWRKNKERRKVYCMNMKQKEENQEVEKTVDMKAERAEKRAGALPVESGQGKAVV